MSEAAVWDVAIVGAGPAGLAAAHAAAAAGARTVVLERAQHPRYKTCGGGIIGASLGALRSLSSPAPADIASRQQVHTATFTRNGRREFTRRTTEPLLGMVRRDEFDDALRATAEAAGATVRQRVTVRGIEQEDGYAYARLADGSRLAARVIIGADGSSGVTARHVGVEFGQVDLGLEVELPVAEPVRRQWRDRVLVDWGPLPGSYGWVFPKEDRLTVGVIAERGEGERTRAYLQGFVERLGLAGIEPAQDSGHLTRCRTDASPLRRGRVIVAGDAAGLLEPWTREGISFALRSGTAAGSTAAVAARENAATALDRYAAEVERTLVPEMRAGRRLLAAFSRHPGMFHLALASPPGWQTFSRFCRGDLAFASTMNRLPVRLMVAAMAGR